MYEYFKNIADKNSCQSIGACSLDPGVTALYEILLNQIREISFYLVKLKEFKIINKTTMSEAIEAMSIFLINTSLNKEKYLSLIKRLNLLKTKAKEKYIAYTKDHELPCEIINTNLVIKDDTTTSELIKYIDSKQKNSDITKQRLFELIAIISKLCAINVIKIKKFDNDFDKYDFEILRFFALTNSYSIRNEKIKRRIIEFSRIALEIKEKLFSCYEEKYGKITNALVNTTPKKGHGILVSGDDLNELEDLLKALETFETKETINVYTNGALFIAHFYPYFKNNRFLKGHLGTDNAQYDFSIFPGSILITKNFIQKIDTLYKGEIFSNKIVSFERVFDIKNNDYSPLIKASLELEGFKDKTEQLRKIEVNYDIDNIEELINNFLDDEIVIVLGKTDENKFLEEYKNTKIVNLNYPIEMGLLIDSVKKLKEKNKDIKITVYFSQCDIESITGVFFLLKEDVKICLADCSNILISPHVIEALKEDFNVKIIKTIE